MLRNVLPSIQYGSLVVGDVDPQSIVDLVDNHEKQRNKTNQPPDRACTN